MRHAQAFVKNFSIAVGVFSRALTGEKDAKAAAKKCLELLHCRCGGTRPDIELAQGDVVALCRAYPVFCAFPNRDPDERIVAYCDSVLADK